MQTLETRADVFRVALRDFGSQLPIRYLGARLKIRRLALYGSDAEVEAKATAIESILAGQGEPLPAFGDGSMLPALERLLELLVKFLPLILALF